MTFLLALGTMTFGQTPTPEKKMAGKMDTMKPETMKPDPMMKMENGEMDAMMMRSKTDPIKVGDTAPDFTLTDQNGKQTTLSAAASPVVLVFYRGYWCPFCTRQLSELRTLLGKDESTKLYAISVDPADKQKVTMEKIAKDGKGDLNFPLLSDPDHKTIDAYGVYDPTYAGQRFDGIPHPVVIVLDKNRKVTFVKVEMDYKIRPSNQDIRAELAKLK